MKTTLAFSILVLGFGLAGCSGGSEPSASDAAAAQDGFSRPLNDAEKAKVGGPADAKAGAALPPGAAAPPANGG